MDNIKHDLTEKWIIGQRGTIPGCMEANNPKRRLDSTHQSGGKMPMMMSPDIE